MTQVAATLPIAGPEPATVEATTRVVGLAPLGIASGVATALFSVTWLVTNLAWPTPSWDGMSSYIASFDSKEMIWIIPAFLLAPAVLILVLCVRATARAERALLANIALAFVGLYVAVITTNYLIQLMVVQPSILAGEGEGLGVLSMANPRGLFYALEAYSYGLQQIGLLALAFVFAGPGLARAIRWSLLGASVIVYPIALAIVFVVPADFLRSFGTLGFMSLVTDFWAIFLALSAILIALNFWRITTQQRTFSTNGSAPNSSRRLPVSAR